MKGKRAEQDVKNEEIENLKLKVSQLQKQKEVEQIQEELETTDDLVNEKDKENEVISPFERVVSEFGENQGWVHVKFRKDMTGTTYKIGKFRPSEFNADALAQEYGGGHYYYDVRNNEGKRVIMHEEHYAPSEKERKGQDNQNNDVAMTQAFDLIKDLTQQISELKQEINRPKEADKDTLLTLITSINQQQQQSQQQQFDMLKTILTAQAAIPKPQNSLQDFLAMFQTIKSLMPQKSEEPKNSVADTIALFNAISDLKDTGIEPKTDWKDVAMKFLTDGSVMNLISNLKQKPIIQPTEQTQPQSDVPTVSQQIAPTNNNAAVSVQTPNNNEVVNVVNNAKIIFANLFKQYEKAIFDLKVQGQSPQDVANTILSICEIQKDLNQICYIMTKDIDTAVNIIMNNTSLFITDKEFIRGIVLELHNFYYDSEMQTDGEDVSDTQNEISATSFRGAVINSDKPTQTQQ